MVDRPGKVRDYRFKGQWRGETRRKVLATTGGRCLFCGWAGIDGKGKGMVLGHRQPHDQGGPDDASNLIPLCPTCHPKFDAGVRRRQSHTGGR